MDEYHRLKVRAAAAVTFAAAKQMDIQASPAVKGIFWRHQAERQARQAGEAGPQTAASHGE